MIITWSGWIRAHIACLLVFLLATSGLAQQQSNNPLSTFDSGSAVTCRTTSGQKLTGTIDHLDCCRCCGSGSDCSARKTAG